MKINTKKGFTLVELLAVIVILAIILVIAVPKIMSVIEDSKKATFESSAKMIASAAETAYTTNKILGKDKELICSDVAKINSNDYASCTINIDNGKPIVTLIGKGKFEGMSVCNGTKTSATVTSDCATDVACFTYHNYYDKYEVNNVEKCVAYFEDLIGPSEICTGGMYNNEITFELLIWEGISGEIFTIEELVENEIIYEPELKGIEIIDYSDTCEKDVVIPSKIDGKNVVSLGEGAFYNMNLTSAVIPSTVETIGNGTFEINKLKTINLPSSVENIGSEAFVDNEFEGTLDLSNLSQLTDISMNAFSNSIKNGYDTVSFYGEYIGKRNEYGFSKIMLPKFIEIIGEGAFAGNNIENLDLSSCTRLTSIGKSSFILNKIKSLSIPDSIISIGDQAFNGNQLEDSDAYIYKRTDNNNDGIAEIDTTTVVSYGGKNKNITIPDGIITIADNSFANNGLTSVIMPNTVVSIGDKSFLNNKLTSIIISENVEIIGSGSFFANDITNLNIPNSVIEVGENAFFNNKISNLTIGNNVITIKNGAFDGNEILELIIPDSVISIGSEAFAGNDLRTITIGTSVTEIGTRAFYVQELCTDKYYPEYICYGNSNINTIINKTGKAFNWRDILGERATSLSENYIFETGSFASPYDTSFITQIVLPS